MRGNQVQTTVSRKEVAAKLLETLQNDEDFKQRFVALIFDIFSCLKQKQTGQYDALLLDTLKPLLKHFNELNPDIAELATQCVPLWIGCIQNSDYYLSAGDLQLVAIAYGMELVLINQNAIASENPPDEFSEDARVIFHRGLHFSYCEKQ
jgi:hypothetical protein